MAKIYRRSVVDPATGKRKRGKVWWITFQENGQQKKRSLQVTDQRIAEIMRAEVEQSTERGRAGLPQSHVDVSQVFEEFKSSVIHKKSPTYGKRMFQQLKPFLLYLQKHRITNLVRVTVNDVERHLEARYEGLSDKSWNDELRVIERFFRFAVERDYLARNPAKKIAKRRVVKHSVEIFTPTELQLIFRHAHKNSVDFYRILLYTGMRDGEARHLQWQDVILDPGREHIRVRSTEVHLTKTRRDRVVPLCREAVEIFQRLISGRDKNNPFVFTGRTGGPRGHNRNTWVACLRRIEEVEGVRIEKGYHMTGLHLFRHTFATNALASGVDIRTVQDWLGHSTILMTQRYTNLLPTQKQEQIHKLRIQIGQPKKAPKSDGAG